MKNKNNQLIAFIIVFCTLFFMLFPGPVKAMDCNVNATNCTVGSDYSCISTVSWNFSDSFFWSSSDIIGVQSVVTKNGLPGS